MPPSKDSTIPEPPVPPSRRVAAPAIPGVALVFSQRECSSLVSPVAAARTIGRDDSADIIVDDPSVSRLHARFEPAKGGLTVTDAGSQNGTFVSGSRVEGSVFAPFGSVVRVGSTIIVVVADSGAFAADGPPMPGLVGGPGLAEVRTRIATVARSSSPVLVEGETGSGKEVVTRAIHQASGRTGELVAVNCAAIASELVESELFGHSRGAFSGSQGARAGLFRVADQGTLLLDEIGELSPAVQAKLLRVLETGEVRGVGEDRGVQVDVRVIAATHRNLASLVTAGSFRADLLHRIAALRVRVPALREHIEDVPRLCELFSSEEGVSMTATVLEKLMLQAWPGNVRELRNVVHAAAAAARYDSRDVITPADVDASAAASESRSDPGDEALRSRVVAALASCEGNVTRAAGELGISRTVLYETIRRLRIDIRDQRRR